MLERRNIRSFVKRSRQLGVAKQKIFDEMWLKHGLGSPSKQISLKKIFGRQNPLILEIGFGNGENIFSLAQKHPEYDFVGIEVYKPGIAHLLSLLKDHPLDNIRIYNEDAVVVLQQYIPNEALDKILILFPDPWPKKRHHKRRLIQPSFVATLKNKLKPGGILQLATDWEDYANHINSVLIDSNYFSPLDLSIPLPFFQNRTIETKFEKRGKNKGHQNFEMIFEKK